MTVTINGDYGITTPTGVFTDSSGNVGVGVTPSAWGTDYKAQQINSSAVAAYQTVQFNIGHNWYDSGAGAHKYINNGYATKLRQQAGEFVFEQATSGTAGNAITFETGMMLNVNGALILKGGSSSASGVGITFPATQAASTNANTLDDYEEGTFTPTIIGTTTAGTGTYNANAQIGRYTKVGNRVYFTVYLAWTAHTGTGNMNVAGLPFTASTATNSYHAVAVWNSNIALTASNLIIAYVNVNTTQILLNQYPVGGGSNSVIPIDTNASLIVSGHYEV